LNLKVSHHWQWRHTNTAQKTYDDKYLVFWLRSELFEENVTGQRHAEHRARKADGKAEQINAPTTNHKETAKTT
jgi:hypothetical protein